MSANPCDEMQLLLQADIDGELAPAEAARVAIHLQTCPNCSGDQARLSALSRQVRREAAYHRAPDAMRHQIAALTPPALAPSPRTLRPRLRTALPVGAGVAIAAAILLAVLPGTGDRLADEIASDHVRALQPGHLLDVVSSDRHTVKPWLSARVDFSPAVPDLAEHGFPLQGGRLDYVAGHPVAVLVYKRREHVIDVYVWPTSKGMAPGERHRNGFNFVRWQSGDLTYWAVSDLANSELTEFVGLLQTAS